VGYFDSVPNLAFKTAPDGRKVVFPWGVKRRGYTVSSEHDYRRMHHQLKLGWVSGILLLFSLGAWGVWGPLNGYLNLGYLILIVLSLLLYVVWWRYWLPSLQPLDERFEVPLSEGWGFTFFLEFSALAFLPHSILAFIFDPGRWRGALGMLAVSFACMFALRLRQ
jgi:hypothetical protein